MESWGSQNFANCQLGDQRLNQRALEIGKALVVGFGQALSMNFKQQNPLKRAYEFLANPKVQFNQLTAPEIALLVNLIFLHKCEHMRQS